MTHRVVSAVVGLVVVALILAACAFAWAVSAKVPVTAGSPAAAPAIPHGVTGDKADCVKCHEIAKLPASHADFTVGDCRSCHGQAGKVGIPHPVDQETADCGKCHSVSADTLPVTHRNFPTSSCEACHDTVPPAVVPHATAGLEERCVTCHGDPALKLGMPADHLTYRVQRCAFCHAGNPKQIQQPPAAGVAALPAPEVTHPVSGAFATCLYCHRIGGKPSLPANHRSFGENTCRFVCHFRSTGK